MASRTAAPARLRRALPHRVSARPADALAALGVLAVTLAWTAATLALWLDFWNPPRSGMLLVLLRMAVPALAVGAAVAYRGSLPAPVVLAVAWVALLAIGIYVTPRLVAQPDLVYTLPVVLVAGLVASRWPAAIVVAAVLMTGIWGTFEAHTGVGLRPGMDLMLAALWVSAVGALLMGRRHLPGHLSLGLIAILVFLGITLVQSRLVGDEAIAFKAIRYSPWALAGAVIVAAAGWAVGVRERAAKGAVLAAAIVGGYAVLRWVIGPSGDEEAFALSADLARFSTVGGELKVIGSFASGQELGMWTSIATPFAIACSFGLSGLWRVVAIFAALTCVGALVASQLRVGLVAVAFAIPVTLVLYQVSRAFPGPRAGVTLALIVVTLAGGGTAISVLSASNPETEQRLESLLDPARDPSVEARRYKWSNAFDDITAHPVGHGLGTASQRARYQSRFYSIANDSLDNGYLVIAYEQGFAVMLLFVAMLLAILGTLGVTAARAPNRISAMLAMGAAGAVVAFAIGLTAANFAEQRVMIMGWLLVGLGLAWSVRPASD